MLLTIILIILIRSILISGFAPVAPKNERPYVVFAGDILISTISALIWGYFILPFIAPRSQSSSTLRENPGLQKPCR